ncbi:hypothetical protein CR513_57686, partial [Mucuna pruriens]
MGIQAAIESKVKILLNFDYSSSQRGVRNSGCKINPILFLPYESWDKHAYYQAIKEEQNVKRLFYDIKHYITNKEYPSNTSTNERITLRRL